MPAFLVVKLKVHDNSWRAEYRANVPSILVRHGGEYLANSQNVEVVEGDEPVPDSMAILRFPSLAELKSFLSDEAYRPYKEARFAGSRSDMAVFEC